LVHAQPELKRAGPTGAKTKLKSGEHSLKLKAAERVREFELEIANDFDEAVDVWGVQTTAGLFIVDFPKKIGAKKSEAFSFIYAAKPGAEGTADLVRVLTSRGIKEIALQHDREQSILLSASQLEWKVGGAEQAKSVTLTIDEAVAVPRHVKTTGGNKAEFKKLKAGSYEISVTPKSVDKATEFIVQIDFEPSLPGTSGIISCRVVP
jgi:hypothetical protein